MVPTLTSDPEPSPRPASPTPVDPAMDTTVTTVAVMDTDENTRTPNEIRCGGCVDATDTTDMTTMYSGAPAPSIEDNHNHLYPYEPNPDYEPPERERDPVKFRKGIRLIAVVDFCVAFGMLFLLSFGFFRVRMDATGDKSVQAFILAMYGLYSIQILVSIILYKGTHKSRPDVVIRSFKQWSTTSNFLNVMLCAEVYFFILIVDGRTLISMSLCFVKVIFRGIAVQIVNYSIREMQALIARGGGGATGQDQSYADDFSSSILLSPSESISLDSPSRHTQTRGHANAHAPSPAAAAEFKVPPPAYEAPPKYEEAMKMKARMVVDDETKRSR